MQTAPKDAFGTHAEGVGHDRVVVGQGGLDGHQRHVGRFGRQKGQNYVASDVRIAQAGPFTLA